MSAYYQLRTNLSFREDKRAAVKDLVDQILECGAEVNVDDAAKDGAFTVDVSVSDSFSGRGIDEIDDLLGKLGYLTVEGTVVEFKHEDDPGYFVVGPSSGAIAQAQRDYLLEKAAVAFRNYLEDVGAYRASPTRLDELKKVLSSLADLSLEANLPVES